MKLTIYISIFFVSILVFSSLTFQEPVNSCGQKTLNSPTKSVGPPPYFSNEPPTNTSCSASTCHDGSTSKVNSGTAIMNLDLGTAEKGYKTGSSYTVTVSMKKSNIKRFGFQIIALQNNNTSISPGTFTLLDSKKTQIRDKANVSWGCCWQNRVWITHTYDGINPDSQGNIEWKFKWNSPNTNVGDITWYLAGLEANNDLTDTLDYTYVTKKTISLNTTKTNNPELNYQLNISPNPVNQVLNISFNNELTPNSIHIFSGSGTTIYVNSKNITKVNNTFSLDLSNYPSGLYFLQWVSPYGTYNKKFYLTH